VNPPPKTSPPHELAWVEKIEPRAYLAAIGVIAGLLAILFLSNMVSRGETQGLDETILRSLRSADDASKPLGPRWVQSAMRDITSFGSTVVLVGFSVVFAGFLITRRDYLDIALIAITLGGGALLNEQLKKFFGRPRPSFVAHLEYINNASFPSGHAMLSMMAYCTMGVLLAGLATERRMKYYILAVALGLSFAVGLSRVYLGVHYPSDVLAGWTIGLVWATLCWLIHQTYRKRFGGGLSTRTPQ
jgi:undecaprenyl-diphosphatase